MTRFDFVIDTVFGLKWVVGYRASRHFGTHQEEYPRVWVLTHLPTGYMITQAVSRTRGQCVAIAERLERMGGVTWAMVTPASPPEIRKRVEKIVAKVKARS